MVIYAFLDFFAIELSLFYGASPCQYVQLFGFYNL